MKEQYLKNSEQFVDEVCQNVTLYGLYDEQTGWANCHAHDNADAVAVYLFWSDKKGANKLKNEEWKDFTVTEIELSVFLDSWLDGMQSQSVFAGVNWDENLYGLEIEAVVLKNSLLERTAEMSQAED